jgi:radical SAM-linked protein
LKVQRLRFRYRVAQEATSLGQRDLVNAWEGAVKVAGLALAYSQGKRPAPQISIAAPLPHRVTSDWELVDVFLDERVDPEQALELLRGRLPAGMEAVAVSEVGVNAPSLQSQLRWAEYQVEVAKDGISAGQVRDAIDALLRPVTFPAEYRRETKVRQYDLRPLILDLRLEEEREDSIVLGMRLRAEPEMTGRADQVALALGLPEPARIHRLRLYTEEGQPAVLAYRRLGEPRDE